MSPTSSSAALRNKEGESPTSNVYTIVGIVVFTIIVVVGILLYKRRPSSSGNAQSDPNAFSNPLYDADDTQDSRSKFDSSNGYSDVIAASTVYDKYTVNNYNDPNIYSAPENIALDATNQDNAGYMDVNAFDDDFDEEV